MWLYDQSAEPPIPSLDVLLRHPWATDKFLTVPARLDTGADVSAIPQFAVIALALQPARMIITEGYNNIQSQANTYVVTLEVGQARFRELEMILIPDPYILLGRNILNYFYIALNGPELNFSLSLQPTNR